jgi:hypothetical protein
MIDFQGIIVSTINYLFKDSMLSAIYLALGMALIGIIIRTAWNIVRKK